MSTNRSVKRVQVAIAATPTDDPVKVADTALLFKRHTEVSLTIVECGIRSFFDLIFGTPASDMPPSGLAAEQYVKPSRVEKQKFCQTIENALCRILPGDAKPEVSYIDGNLHHIASTLARKFDIIVMPHQLRLSITFGLLRPAIDNLLIKNKVATMFCVDTSTCRKIVVAQVDASTSFMAGQILSRLTDSLGVPVYRWFICKSNRKKSQLPEIKGQELYGIPDNYILDDESVLAEQLGTWLVIPRVVILGLFRFRRLRSVLRNWQGNCLVLT